MKHVGIGTKLPQGNVVKILRDQVIVEQNGKKVTLSFSQVESIIFGG